MAGKPRDEEGDSFAGRRLFFKGPLLGARVMCIAQIPQIVVSKGLHYFFTCLNPLKFCAS